MRMRNFSGKPKQMQAVYTSINIRQNGEILKKCDIWCHKTYTDKNEKQVGCFVTLDGVKTFSDIYDH